jgi:ribosomal protein L40E
MWLTLFIFFIVVVAIPIFKLFKRTDFTKVDESAPDWFNKIQKTFIENKGINCGMCGAANGNSSAYCRQCGNKLEQIITCAKCGKLLGTDAKFCGKCGTKVNAAVSSV